MLAARFGTLAAPAIWRNDAISDAGAERLFGERALDAVQELLQATRDMPPVSISSATEEVTLTRQAEVNVERLIGPRREVLGAVEGRLQMVSTRGGIHFSGYETLTGRRIRCSVPEEKLPDVIHAFNRRVAVRGRAQVNAAGNIIRISVDEVYEFPPEADLPTTADILGSIPDLTNGKSLDDHLCGLRDAG